MKLLIVITLLICLMVCSLCNGQIKESQNNSQPNIDTTTGEDDLAYSLKTAHPNAQALMKEDFYWSTIEETGPFGSDDRHCYQKAAIAGSIASFTVTILTWA